MATDSDGDGGGWSGASKNPRSESGKNPCSSAGAAHPWATAKVPNAAAHLGTVCRSLLRAACRFSCNPSPAPKAPAEAGDAEITQSDVMQVCPPGLVGGGSGGGIDKPGVRVGGRDEGI